MRLRATLTLEAPFGASGAHIRPERWAGRHIHCGQGVRFSCGCAAVFPDRRATHFAPLPYCCALNRYPARVAFAKLTELLDTFCQDPNVRIPSYGWLGQGVHDPSARKQNVRRSPSPSHAYLAQSLPRWCFVAAPVAAPRLGDCHAKRRVWRLASACHGIGRMPGSAFV